MGMYDRRKEEFERKFAHEQEIQFKVKTKRAKLLGLWMADNLGMSGDQRVDYSKQFVKLSMEYGDDAVLFQKICEDLDRAGIEKTSYHIHHIMDELMGEALNQVMTM
jgi:hypothetical protein